MIPVCLVSLRAVIIGDIENSAFFDHIKHLQNRSFVGVLVQKIICHCLLIDYHLSNIEKKEIDNQKISYLYADSFN